MGVGRFLFLSFLRVWNHWQQGLHNWQGLVAVVDVEYVMQFGAWVWTTRLGVAHQGLYGGVHLDIAQVVARHDDGLLVNVDHPVAKHLFGAHKAHALQLGANKLNKFGRTGHRLIVNRQREAKIMPCAIHYRQKSNVAKVHLIS